MTHTIQLKNRKNSRKGLLLILMTLGFAGGLLSQQVWTLEDCIYYAFENNLTIKQSELQIKTSDADLFQSKLDLLPTLNGNISYTSAWGRSFDQVANRYTFDPNQISNLNVNSSLTLFNGLTKTNTVRQFQLDNLADKYDTDKIKNDISLNIAAAYLSILFAKEQEKNALEQVNITKQQIDRTNKLVEAGTVARGNLLEIQAQNANEEVNLISAKNQLSLAYLDLLQLLDMEGNTELEIRDPNIVNIDQPNLLPPDNIYNTATSIMPEVRAAEYRLQSTARGLAIAKGNRYPSLTISGGYGTQYSPLLKNIEVVQDPDGNPTIEEGDIIPFGTQWVDNRNFFVTLRLNIPIFNGYQVGNWVEKQKIGLENANLQLELTKQNLRKNIESAYADALAAYQTYQANKKSLESIKEAFTYTEQKFNVGMVNAVDYNVSKIQLATAESNLLTAKYDYIFKSKILDFYLGRPITLKDLENFE